MTLRARNLEFAYAGRPVLRGVDFEPLPRGAVTALIGPNAAGKSTLFRCTAGLLRTAPGTLFLDGEDIARLDRSRRSRLICFMSQHFSSNAALTVFEIVLLARRQLRGWRTGRADLETVETLLARVGISHLAQAYIGELSGGQQQMVSMCQTLAREPRLFLLDEPTSALDLRHQLELMEMTRTMTIERNAVTVIALHDLNLAARFADHLLLMREGRIVSAGSPDSLLTSTVLGEVYGIDIETTRTSSGTLVASGRLSNAVSRHH